MAAESARLRLFAFAQLPIGLALVIAAAVRSLVSVIPTANQIWLGTMGATLLLTGIFDLLGHRVLAKASGAGTQASAAHA